MKSSPSSYVKYLHLHQPTAQNHVYKQLLTFFFFFSPLCKFFTCGCISWCGFQSARCHHHCLSATASLQPTSSQVARSNFRFKVSLWLLRRGINMEKSSFPPTAHTLWQALWCLTFIISERASEQNHTSGDIRLSSIFKQHFAQTKDLLSSSSPSSPSFFPPGFNILFYCGHLQHLQCTCIYCCQQKLQQIVDKWSKETQYVDSLGLFIFIVVFKNEISVYLLFCICSCQKYHKPVALVALEVKQLC